MIFFIFLSFLRSLIKKINVNKKLKLYFRLTLMKNIQHFFIEDGKRYRISLIHTNCQSTCPTSPPHLNRYSYEL